MLTEAPQMAVKDAIIVILTVSIAPSANIIYNIYNGLCQLKFAFISP